LEKIMANAPVPFTRDALTTYEKQPQVAAVQESPKPAAVEQAPVADTPVVESDASDTSSVEDVSTDPAALGDDGTSDGIEDSSTSTADSDSETPASETGDGKPKPRGSAQERIEELVTERNAYRKYGEHLLATIEELKTAKPAATSKTDAPAAATTADSGDEPPTLEQHQFDPVAFSKAQSKWLKDQVTKQVSATLAAERGQQEATSSHAKFIEREAAARKEFKDFDIMTSKNPNFPKFSKEATNLIVGSDIGPRIAYEIGKDPALSARIEKMTAIQQIAAIGRVEGAIMARTTAAPTKGTPPKKTVTKAPPPPTPIKGGSNPQKNISEMSMSEFVAHERAQKLAAREQNLKIRRAMR
jgi:hypothetical protein